MKNKVNFVPMNGTVVIELPEIKEETSSGIIKSPDMIEAEKNEHDTFFDVIAVSEDAVVPLGTKIMVNFQQCQIVDIDKVKVGLVPKHAIVGYRP